MGEANKQERKNHMTVTNLDRADPGAPVATFGRIKTDWKRRK